jgi:hypothetical protein
MDIKGGNRQGRHGKQNKTKTNKNINTQGKVRYTKGKRYYWCVEFTRFLGGSCAAGMEEGDFLLGEGGGVVESTEGGEPKCGSPNL